MVLRIKHVNRTKEEVKKCQNCLKEFQKKFVDSIPYWCATLGVMKALEFSKFLFLWHSDTLGQHSALFKDCAVSNWSLLQSTVLHCRLLTNRGPDRSGSCLILIRQQPDRSGCRLILIWHVPDRSGIAWYQAGKWCLICLSRIFDPAPKIRQSGKLAWYVKNLKLA